MEIVWCFFISLIKALQVSFKSTLQFLGEFPLFKCKVLWGSYEGCRGVEKKGLGCVCRILKKPAAGKAAGRDSSGKG